MAGSWSHPRPRTAPSPAPALPLQVTHQLVPRRTVTQGNQRVPPALVAIATACDQSQQCRQTEPRAWHSKHPLTVARSAVPPVHASAARSCVSLGPEHA